MGLSAVVPVLHGLKLYGLQEMNDRISLVWLVTQGFLYVLGAGLYAVSFSTSDGQIHEWSLSDSLSGTGS